MPRKADSATALIQTITQMKTKRQRYVEEIAVIDKTFVRLGIPVDGPYATIAGAPGTGKKRGRPKGQRRHRFSMSGEESVLKFVKQSGKPNAADVNKKWRSEGRGGKADNALSKLVKTGRLKRVKVKGERGSRYALA